MKTLYVLLIGIALNIFTVLKAEAQLSPEEILAKGNEYYLKADFQNAINMFTDFLESYPQDVNVLNYRGLSYSNLHNYNRAIEDFSSAIRVQKANSMSYVYRAMAYAGNNNIPAAKKDYEDAMFYNVSNLEAYYGLNLLYVKGGEYQRSLKLLEKAIALEPKGARGYFLKAFTYSFMNDTNKVFENIAVGLSWDSTYFMKYTEKDMKFARVERYKDIQTILINEVRKNPNDYLPYFKRGMLYYMIGSYNEAKDDFEKAIKLNKRPSELFTNTTNKLIRACYRVD